MTWSERMKKTIDTFKHMVLPLYLFYLLFSLIGAITAIISFGLFLLPYLRTGDLGSAFPSMPYMGPEMPYLDPSIPVPPGYNPSWEYGPSQGYGFFNEFAPYLDLIPQFIGLFALVMLISWLMVSFFLTGVFNLTKKAYDGKVKLGDIKFKGFSRIMGWHLILALSGLILLGIGIFIALSFSSEYAMAFFTIIYLFILLVLGLFFAPWLLATPYFILNNPQLSFGQSFKASWKFFRLHMGALWGGFITILGIQILMNLISRNAADMGLLISFIISPFLAILPIVWVLTLEEKEDFKDYSATVPYTPTTVPDNLTTTPDIQTAAPDTPQATCNTPETTSNFPPNSSYTPKNPYTPPSYPYTTTDAEDSPFAAPSTYTTTPDEDDYPINFCPTCGKKVRENASYCSQCGTKL